MTRADLEECIHGCIQKAVERSGGDWKRSYKQEVIRILWWVGKLTPEPKPQPEVPKYDINLVRRAGEKYQVTVEDRRILSEVMKGFNGG